MTDQLRDTLAENRQRVVTRVLQRCGYRMDSDTNASIYPTSISTGNTTANTINSATTVSTSSTASTASSTLGPSNPSTDDFTATEAQLLRSGRFRWRGRWFGRRLPGCKACPSPWSRTNLRGWWQRCRARWRGY